jgi:hypothetical protein
MLTIKPHLCKAGSILPFWSSMRSAIKLKIALAGLERGRFPEKRI